MGWNYETREGRERRRGRVVELQWPPRPARMRACLEDETMDVHLPLDKMTTAEKLRVIEEVWDDLRRTPDDVPAPSWHADVLEARERRIREGSSQFLDWTEAKRSVRERTR